MIIDTFFFRSTAMLPPDQQTLVLLEYPIPAVQAASDRPEVISGVLDYTAMVAGKKAAGALPPSQMLR